MVYYYTVVLELRIKERYQNIMENVVKSVFTKNLFNSLGDNFDSGINIRIKELRKFYGLTQTDIAKVLNISQQQYARYEIVGYNINRTDSLLLAIFYNVSLDFLYGFKDEPIQLVENLRRESHVNGYYLSKMRKK